MSTPVNNDHKNHSNQDLDNKDRTPNSDGGKRSADPKGRPESVRLTVQLWGAAVLLQLVHLILNVVMIVIDPSSLQAAARETAESQEMEEVSSGLLLGSVIGSVVIMTLINLLILGLLTWALVAITRRQKHAPSARHLWLVFSIYFALQAMTVFALSSAGSDVPDILFLTDGSIQILTGVAAVMGMIFASRSDTLDWVDPNRKDKMKLQSGPPGGPRPPKAR